MKGLRAVEGLSLAALQLVTDKGKWKTVVWSRALRPLAKLDCYAVREECCTYHCSKNSRWKDWCLLVEIHPEPPTVAAVAAVDDHYLPPVKMSCMQGNRNFEAVSSRQYQH